MSDRGPADEEDGSSQLTPAPMPHTHTRAGAHTRTHMPTQTPTQAQICLKTNNISHSHRQTVSVTGATTFPLQNGHRAQTHPPEMSPLATTPHTPRQPIKAIYI